MNAPSRAKRAVYAIGAALGITIGAAGLAAAASSDSTPSQPATDQSQAGTDNATGDDQSPSYQGSITAPETPDNGGTEAPDDETAEAQQLASLAKITPEEASAAATAQVPGTVGKVELEDENGSVVYGVEITTADGHMFDVKVDAGNGSVLHQEADDDSGEESESGTSDDADETEDDTQAPESQPAG